MGLLGRASRVNIGEIGACFFTDKVKVTDSWDAVFFVLDDLRRRRAHLVERCARVLVGGFSVPVCRPYPRSSTTPTACWHAHRPRRAGALRRACDCEPDALETGRSHRSPPDRAIDESDIADEESMHTWDLARDNVRYALPRPGTFLRHAVLRHGSRWRGATSIVATIWTEKRWSLSDAHVLVPSR